MTSLVAASPPQPVEPPPAVIASNLHNGVFDPGDYRWMRGQFDGASEADKANDEAIDSWRRRCRAKDLTEARAELANIGIRAGSSLQTIPYRTLICNQVSTLPEPLNLHDWAGFERDVAYVRPIAQGFLAAVALAEKAGEPRSDSLGDQLDARSAGEQTLRRGLDWASGNSSDAPVLSLAAQQRGVLVSEIAMALAARDHANTEWLKAVVAKQGWPLKTKVGDAAADVAWLLVQHADADPAFQAKALRLMEPLVAAREVNPKNYAYLYDRVMLKITGKQRYASQLTCRDGHWRPQPLEDEVAVDLQRRKGGLSLLADDLKQVDKEMGACEVPPNNG